MGSTVIDETEADRGVLVILAGTLDNPSWVEPTMAMYCDSAQPWVSLGGEWQRFPKMPG
jgi:hypothetical protein